MLVTVLHSVAAFCGPRNTLVAPSEQGKEATDLIFVKLNFGSYRLVRHENICA